MSERHRCPVPEDGAAVQAAVAAVDGVADGLDDTTGDAQAVCVDRIGFRRLGSAMGAAAVSGVPFDAIWLAWLDRVSGCFEPREAARELWAAQEDGLREDYEKARAFYSSATQPEAAT